MEKSRKHPGLLSISCPLLTHSLGRRLRCSLRTTSKRWEEVWREGNSYSSELTRGKAALDRRLAAKRKRGIICGWGLTWKIRDALGNLGKCQGQSTNKKTFYLPMQVLLHQQWRVFGEWVGVIHFLGWWCLCHERLWSFSFIHPSIQYSWSTNNLS